MLGTFKVLAAQRSQAVWPQALTRGRRRLLPAERIILVFGLLALGLYAYYGLALRDPLRIYRQRMVSCGFLYLLGLAICLARVRLNDLRRQLSSRELVSISSSYNRFRDEYLIWPRLIVDLRYMNIISLMFMIYVQLKNLIPKVNPLVYDPFFSKLENGLFGGHSATHWIQSLFGVESAWFWSECYTLYYPYLASLVFVVMLAGQRAMLQEFSTAFVLTWFVGILVVYLIPTLGPCFYSPESIQSLPYTEVTKLQQHLFEHKLFLEQNPFSDKGVYLISGLPSLHIAIVALGTYYLYQVKPFLGVASGCFLVLTFISTLYFGWHYLADDFAALLLAFTAILMAKGNLNR